MSIIAGLVIETVRGAAPRVATRLLRVPRLELQGGDGDHRLAAVWSARSGEALEVVAEQILAYDCEVLGIYPTFVSEAGEEEA